MTREPKYVKPNMGSLPKRLGKSVLQTIRNTPPVDKQALRNKANEWLQKFLEKETNGK